MTDQAMESVPGMHITQALKRAAHLYGQQDAILGDNVTRTWSEVSDRVARLAAALVEISSGPGFRAAILAANQPRYLEFYFAVAWAGGVMVPLNNRWSSEEVSYCLDDSGAEVLFSDLSLWSVASKAAQGQKSLRACIILDENQQIANTLSFEELVRLSTPIPDALRGGSDLAGIFYTGGTTGKSKGVMLSHQNLMCNALNILQAEEYCQSTVFLHASPMFHLADAGAIYATTISGGSHCFLDAFNPDAFLRKVERFKVTHAVLVPTMIQMIIESTSIDTHDLSSLHTLLYGAAPISEVLLKRAINKLPSTGFIQGYGMTELSPVATLLSKEDHADPDKLKSAGRPVLSVEIKIIDAEGAEVEFGTIGQVAVRSPTVMVGYWNQPAETRQTMWNGWLLTGDAGYVNSEGYLFIVDRIKDMIISGGENIYSIEVERVLLQHPKIRQCAVIGLPDEKWGERVHAIIVPFDEVALYPAEIQEHCKSWLGAYKIPRSMEIRYSDLPVSAAGKVLKASLKQEYLRQADFN